MGAESKFDDTKGRAKEGLGDLTGDKDMQREGQADQAGAQVKEKAEQAKDKAGDMVDSVKDKFNKDK